MKPGNQPAGHSARVWCQLRQDACVLKDERRAFASGFSHHGRSAFLWPSVIGRRRLQARRMLSQSTEKTWRALPAIPPDSAQAWQVIAAGWEFAGSRPPMAERARKTLWWADDHLEMIDQTRLPGELATLRCQSVREVARAIKEMRVRGAPAIGVAAAYGIVLAAQASRASSVEALLSEAQEAGALLRSTRPTAVNLAWAVERMLRVLADRPDVGAAREALLAEARCISDEDEAMCRAIGRYGAELVPDGARILTHCNAGALATVSYGTALGVIRAAHEQGKRVHVFVDETRPLLQGARLTAWELSREDIPLTLITDNMAGHLMRLGKIDLAVVGADRIAANGDVANKIGTYTVAVLAKEHGLPFYVAAPSSTVDLTLASGEQIPIEERRPEEVLEVSGRRVAPLGVQVANPAFDVTPARYVSAIITEAGVIRPPFGPGLAKIVPGNRVTR